MKLNMQKSRFPSWIYVFAELCSVNNRTVACSHSEDFEDNKVVLNAEQVYFIFRYTADCRLIMCVLTKTNNIKTFCCTKQKLYMFIFWLIGWRNC